MSNVFDGKLFANRYYLLLKEFLIHHDLVDKISLKVVLANDNPSSKLYVAIKERVSKSIGINFRVIKLAKDSGQEDILQLIESENVNENTDGIIVQLPLANEINVNMVLNSIVSTKDVDGLSDISLGKLVLGDRRGFIPCTALAVLKVLYDKRIEISGKTVVVIGRSSLVGRPISILLSCKPYDATVITCHSKSVNLGVYVRQADIIISAVGKPKLIDASMIAGHPCVIDIGISGVEIDGNNVLVGDVDFEAIKDNVKFITPVTGGIGPVTVLMLMFNTIKAHLIRHNKFDVLEQLLKLVEV
ncbi:bifunctional 5,10-methylenetetrahydrofolate dehydrogenase/5,10-methenyltetrahydrofolate cyclohydrolase [Borrelia anserina]|uniref:Bifunctional protein FolD n=2 Tax=Borrelia anserina TaxID=143 RepID=W5SMA1_BORAN|nr:bifunctional 5,10-methylenetetrahydrofolate dehydrogenase/5,10-methenyltetrahydrofolate cyclohydrolase [Borrelia anserina]AHH07990.1 Methylenetetrahydrofolate dehydrogenase (NADP+) [Borrelia anserina BA2]APR64544.1 bifunctional 5,10-methylene-tetrahydrofolate dehydrogenase/5,10-methylene-tetrahydrofolate cyclohydrolase [Borrelia anserina Es]UPA06455.1 bifunctional 5,10-methylenetetrahydrofolate dehydrogenase/5,10-methenyltetrahydrofolate cyclohydrolase [Borrelia anserina]